MKSQSISKPWPLSRKASKLQRKLARIMADIREKGWYIDEEEMRMQRKERMAG